MLLNHCTLSTGSRTVALLVLLFVFTPTSHADSYLADLENEANESGLLESSKKSHLGTSYKTNQLK